MYIKLLKNCNIIIASFLIQSVHVHPTGSPVRFQEAVHWEPRSQRPLCVGSGQPAARVCWWQTHANLLEAPQNHVLIISCLDSGDHGNRKG